MNAREYKIRDTLNIMLHYINLFKKKYHKDPNEKSSCNEFGNIARSIYVYSEDFTNAKNRQGTGEFKNLKEFKFSDNHSSRLKIFLHKFKEFTKKIKSRKAGPIVDKLKELSRSLSTKPASYNNLPEELKLEILKSTKADAFFNLAATSKSYTAASNIFIKKIKNHLKCNDEDIRFLKNDCSDEKYSLHKDENIEDWYKRISKLPNTSSLTFTERGLDTIDPVDFINESIPNLLNGKVMSLNSKNNPFDNFPFRRYPDVDIELDIPPVLLQRRLNEDIPDPYDIARHIKRVNQRDVKYDERDNKIHYKKYEKFI